MGCVCENKDEYCDFCIREICEKEVVNYNNESDLLTKLMPF